MTVVLSMTSVRNEAPYLIEWLAWHRMIGVNRFLICSNDCEDGTDAMLDLLERAGVVTHLPQPARDGAQGPPRGVQWQALRRMWRHPARKEADWVLISDLDEFPVIHVGAGRLEDLFAHLPGAELPWPEARDQEGGTDAVALPWRLFGNAGISGFADRPVTAQFLRSAPARMLHPVAATFFKTVFRPAAFQGPGVHRPAQRAGARPVSWRDGSGRAMPPLYAENPGRLSLIGLDDCRALAEIHHYSLRSAEAFLVKTLRGLPNRADKPVDLSYWVERNYNTEPNLAALPRQKALADEIAQLLTIPGLADLHRTGCEWHRAAARRMLHSRAGYELYAALRHCSDSTVLPQPEALRLLRLFSEIEPDPAVP
ncbi:glycosyltransferase family 2 protein [Paenirhodobacter enshiensis]|uniref:glycosyltransferase family 2 protein n=1 Tax=Paenirhodobacter enshiensis TaxID=1105367 RepID=UPI0006909C7B|nr:glycosyltransferase family 2 protein [Paenirhodobacter enshiensis]